MDTEQINYMGHTITVCNTGSGWVWDVRGIAMNGGWCNLEGGEASTKRSALSQARWWVGERVNDLGLSEVAA